MSTQTVIVDEADMEGFKVSVTARDAGDDWKHLENIIYRTGFVWFIIAEKLEQGDYTMAGGSVEEEYAAFLNNPKDTDAPRPNPPIEFTETFGEPRATIWDTYRGSRHVNFHLNSNDIPQVAINTWLANKNAIRRLTEKFASPQQKVSEQRQDAPLGVSEQQQPVDKPATPMHPVSAIITATCTPSPATPQYADGQQVSFQINKIVAGSNKGSATYALWGSLGTKYPLVTVYRCKTNSADLTPTYQKIAPVIEKLGLSLDKPEVSGNWYLVCRAAHSNGKEYLNAELLEPVV